MLELRSLYKHFGGVVATDRLDLAIPKGEAHALIGPNGAGKTTLLAQIFRQRRLRRRPDPVRRPRRH
jgi:branched-chain amino acid transport system ATP-binding protein